MSAATAGMVRPSRLQLLLLKWRTQACLVLGLRRRAGETLEEMLALQPDNAYALSSRAHVRAEAGERAGAIADYRKLLAAHANDAPGWFNLGFLLEQETQLGEAEAAFRRAIELEPKLDRAWYGLGLVLIRQHRYDDAVVALTRNTELQPMSPHAWYQLARVHVDRHRPDEAVKVIRHLKGFEPKVAAQLERETGLMAGAAGEY
ncbi:MAG: tetratricopeptide repeat protein [Pseudomonadota bacterium]